MHGYPMSEIYYLLHDPDKVLLIFFFCSPQVQVSITTLFFARGNFGPRGKYPRSLCIRMCRRTTEVCIIGLLRITTCSS